MLDPHEEVHRMASHPHEKADLTVREFQAIQAHVDECDECAIIVALLKASASPWDDLYSRN